VNRQNLRTLVKEFHGELLHYRASILKGNYAEAERLRSRLNVTFGMLRDDLNRLKIPNFLNLSGRHFPVFETALRPYNLMARPAITATMDQAIQNLEVALGVLRRQPTPRVRKPTEHPVMRKAFLVHGHDHYTRDAVARFLQVMGTEPIILSDRPGKGRTLIEKLEQESLAGSFAVVLLTADDVGAKKGDEDDLRARARQNVILELGYFIGKLGRKNVAALYQDGVEIPTDYHGVEYLPLSGDWKRRLANELRAAGFDVDMNKAV
jgi:predicted nucleotide-binding protein